MIFSFLSKMTAHATAVCSFAFALCVTTPLWVPLRVKQILAKILFHLSSFPGAHALVLLTNSTKELPAKHCVSQHEFPTLQLFNIEVGTNFLKLMLRAQHMLGCATSAWLRSWLLGFGQPTTYLAAMAAKKIIAATLPMNLAASKLGSSYPFVAAPYTATPANKKTRKPITKSTVAIIVPFRRTETVCLAFSSFELTFFQIRLTSVMFNPISRSTSMRTAPSEGSYDCRRSSTKNLPA